MEDIDVPKFSTSQVARAAGVKAPTLHSYFQRGHFRMIGKRPEQEGLPTLFTARDALHIAVAVKLASIGGDPAAAWQSTTRFTHIGDMERDPGSLYDIREYGETLFMYWPDRGSGRLTHEKALQDNPLYEAHIGSNRFGESEAVVIVNLNRLQNRVMAALQGREVEG